MNAVTETKSETPAGASASASTAPPYPSNFYAWYCVIVLLGIYLNSFLDRQLVALVVGPIKSSMQLTDSQVGFLMGPAFAIFYTIAGLPLGFAADRFSRRWLIGIGQFFWSIASACFGLGNNYGQLIAARVGVGVGEASLSPSAYSIIADIFPPHRLGRAISVYAMGIYVGGGMANFIGGLMLRKFGAETIYHVPVIGERMGWQVIFLVASLTPIIPLTLAMLTLKEPARRGLGMKKQDDGSFKPVSVPIPMFIKYALKNKTTLMCHGFGFAFLSFSGYGASAWTPEFFIRNHGWSRADTGVYTGLMSMIAGPIGLYLGGWLGDRFAAKGRRDSKMFVGLIAATVWFPFGIYPLMPSGELAFLLLIPATMFSAMPWGIAPAAIQEIMPNQMRGQASAVYLFIISIIGLGLGPQALALVTDHVFQDEKQIHMSLLWTTTLAHIASATLLWLGLSHFRKSRDNLDAWLKAHS
jgi:MFS family permease